MGPIDLFLHLAGLLAPAAAVALVLSLLGRVVLRGETADRSWLPSFGIGFLTGAAVLVGGLLAFGRDGRMLTYAVLVLACASSQWLLTRGWR